MASRTSDQLTESTMTARASWSTGTRKLQKEIRRRENWGKKLMRNKAQKVREQRGGKAEKPAQGAGAKKEESEEDDSDSEEEDEEIRKAIEESKREADQQRAERLLRHGEPLAALPNKKELEAKQKEELAKQKQERAEVLAALKAPKKAKPKAKTLLEFQAEQGSIASAWDTPFAAFSPVGLSRSQSGPAAGAGAGAPASSFPAPSPRVPRNSPSPVLNFAAAAAPAKKAAPAAAPAAAAVKPVASRPAGLQPQPLASGFSSSAASQTSPELLRVVGAVVCNTSESQSRLLLIKCMDPRINLPALGEAFRRFGKVKINLLYSTQDRLIALLQYGSNEEARSARLVMQGKSIDGSAALDIDLAAEPLQITQPSRDLPKTIPRSCLLSDGSLPSVLPTASASSTASPNSPQPGSAGAAAAASPKLSAATAPSPKLSSMAAGAVMPSSARPASDIRLPLGEHKHSAMPARSAVNNDASPSLDKRRNDAQENLQLESPGLPKPTFGLPLAGATPAINLPSSNAQTPILEAQGENDNDAGPGDEEYETFESFRQLKVQAITHGMTHVCSNRGVGPD